MTRDLSVIFTAASVDSELGASDPGNVVPVHQADDVRQQPRLDARQAGGDEQQKNQLRAFAEKNDPGRVTGCSVRDWSS